MNRQIAILASALLTAPLNGCAVPGVEIGAGGNPPGGSPNNPSTASLTLTPCNGQPAFPDLTGLYGVILEAQFEVSGGQLQGRQQELVTRLGIAELCQDQQTVRLRLLICETIQTPLLDKADTCATQRPDPTRQWSTEHEIWGELDPTGNEVQFQPWRETLGLTPGAQAPPEPTGIDPIEAETLLDQDEDGWPGVTLYGDSTVPTITWAAQTLDTAIVLNANDPRGLSGPLAAELTRTILGGPATRALRGQKRQYQTGAALLVPLDGRNGGPHLDNNQDGQATCAELAPHIGHKLPAPIQEVVCARD